MENALFRCRNIVMTLSWQAIWHLQAFSYVVLHTTQELCPGTPFFSFSACRLALCHFGLQAAWETGRAGRAGHAGRAGRARRDGGLLYMFKHFQTTVSFQYPFSILSVSFQYPLAPGWILDDIFRSSHGRWKQACNSERDEKCLMVFPHASFHGKIVQPRAVSRPRKDKKIKQSEFQYFRQRFPERIPVGTLEQSFFHSEDGTAFDFG
jgi:hypothetical protein